MKTDWKKVKLGEIATFSNGVNFGKESYTSGVKLIGVSNFGNKYFPEYEELDEINEKVLRENDYLKDGDIVFVRSNGNKELVGRCMLIQNPPSPVTYSGFCIRARLNDTATNNPRFFAYYFKSKIFRKSMSNSAVGANIQNLNQGLLSNHEISLPPLETQQKIAHILSRYDEAIENNNKRIKLLEQMAQNLYKEWFVRFRFPGYENCEFENGIPVGWKVERLFDIANVTYGYAFASELFCEDKTLNPVVRIRDILYNQTNTCTSEVCADKYIIKEHEILVGMDGIFHMCMWNGKKAYQNQRVVKLTPKTEDISNYFLFLAVQPQVKFWEQTIAGTTVAHLGDKHLKRMTILLPSENLLKKSTKIFNSLMKQKNQLFIANENLAKQRDLLLPRLMSGKVEV